MRDPKFQFDHPELEMKAQEVCVCVLVLQVQAAAPWRGASGRSVSCVPMPPAYSPASVPCALCSALHLSPCRMVSRVQSAEV